MITDSLFEGLKAVEIRTPAIKAVVVVQKGPRIAFLGKPDGENILFWDSKAEIGWRSWRLMGGHRVWIARPGADEGEETYEPDNAPCDVSLKGDTLTVTAPLSPLNFTRKGLSIRILGDRTIEVDNFVENPGPMLYSGSIWALTCTRPVQGSRYAFAIGDDNPWNIFTLVAFRSWGRGHGNETGFGDDQFSCEGDLFYVTPKGRENKRMLQSHLGIAAMDDPARGLTFLKKVAYYPDAAYPLNTNMAVYIGPDNFMVELESMGPERTLKPGQRLSHVETWTLTEKSIGLTNAKALADAFA